MVADKNNRSALPEATSTSHKRHKLKYSVVPKIEVSTSKESKIGKEPTKDTNALSESKEKLPFADTAWKRKRKSMGSKVNTFLYALFNRFWHFASSLFWFCLIFFSKTVFYSRKHFLLQWLGLKKSCCTIFNKLWQLFE